MKVKKTYNVYVDVFENGETVQKKCGTVTTTVGPLGLMTANYVEAMKKLGFRYSSTDDGGRWFTKGREEYELDEIKLREV